MKKFLVFTFQLFFIFNVLSSVNARTLENIQSWSIESSDNTYENALESNHLAVVDPNATTLDQISAMKNAGQTVIARFSISRLPVQSQFEIKRKRILKKLRKKSLALMSDGDSTQGYYEVPYWKSSWKKKYLFKNIEHLMNYGYDGICFDIDAYQYWGNRKNDLNQAADLMAELIDKINKKYPSLYLCQENGTHIFYDLSTKWKDRLSKKIDTIIAENLFYNQTETSPSLDEITFIHQQTNIVLNAEYVGSNLETEYVNQLNTSNINIVGYSPYFSVRKGKKGGNTTPQPEDPPSENNPPASEEDYLGQILPNDFKAFNSQSFWNIPIDNNPILDPDSSLMINNLQTVVNSLGINATKWSVPVHVINSDLSPKFQIPTSSSALFYTVDPNNDKIAEGGDSLGIPIPAEVWADPEADGHMCLIDINKNISWDFSRFEKLPDGSYRASKIDTFDLNSTGERTPFWGANGNWWANGARGAGFPLIAGLILLHEIESGIANPNDPNSGIQHALVFASPINRKSLNNDGSRELNLPATRTDGWGIGNMYIPEGARLQLNPDYDISHLTPATQVIARALQKYGMLNGDNAAGFALYAQNLGADGGAWKNYPVDLYNIPLNQFRVIKGESVIKN